MFFAIITSNHVRYGVNINFSIYFHYSQNVICNIKGNVNSTNLCLLLCRRYNHNEWIKKRDNKRNCVKINGNSSKIEAYSDNFLSDNFITLILKMLKEWEKE